MATWKTLGLRGSALENLIDRTNDYYKSKNIARIDKAATPVKVTSITSEGRISEGYFEKKSTVDYYGMAQGTFIAFDAKQTRLKSFPLKNVHRHQVEYMEDITRHGGVVFILVEFSCDEAYYILPFEVLKDYFDNAENSGRKSIPRSAFSEELRIKFISSGVLNYLETVNSYFDWKHSYYEGE